MPFCILYFQKDRFQGTFNSVLLKINCKIEHPAFACVCWLTSLLVFKFIVWYEQKVLGNMCLIMKHKKIVEH